jgi:CheY-like chemotaxis protein
MEDSLPGNGERVLVVDDDAPVASLIAIVLARLKYEIICFTDPIEALATFERSPDLFDLLLIDFTMPQMTGTEVISRIRPVRPNIPVILCTGNRGMVEEAEIKRLGIGLILEKPFNAAGLAGAVRQVLAAKSLRQGEVGQAG